VNHLAQTAAIDFFTVPTATFRVLFVFVVLSHERRQVQHFGVTEHPTQDRTMQQMRESFPWDEAPRYVLRDRDAIYGRDFADMTRNMGMEEVLTAPRSPWQNPLAERLVGSIRRECLDHVIVWNERSLRRALQSYFAYYRRSRTHLALGKDARVDWAEGRWLPWWNVRGRVYGFDSGSSYLIEVRSGVGVVRQDFVLPSLNTDPAKRLRHAQKSSSPSYPTPSWYPLERAELGPLSPAHRVGKNDRRAAKKFCLGKVLEDKSESIRGCRPKRARLPWISGRGRRVWRGDARGWLADRPRLRQTFRAASQPAPAPEC
jgi:hypothetical protein